jgi:hypothetical protein
VSSGGYLSGPWFQSASHRHLTPANGPNPRPLEAHFLPSSFSTPSSRHPFRGSRSPSSSSIPASSHFPDPIRQPRAVPGIPDLQDIRTKTYAKRHTQKDVCIKIYALRWQPLRIRHMRKDICYPSRCSCLRVLSLGEEGIASGACLLLRTLRVVFCGLAYLLLVSFCLVLFCCVLRVGFNGIMVMSV